MMRISPLIVWAADLSDENFCKAIRCDTEITHPNKVVQEAVIVFSLTVRFILRNRNEVLRARFAYDEAINKINSIQDKEVRDALNEWINLAKTLYNFIDKKELVKFQEFDKKYFNCC
jgi:ADP-ribosylglycohydrolase